jgi:hypothetical protein
MQQRGRVGHVGVIAAGKRSADFLRSARLLRNSTASENDSLSESAIVRNCDAATRSMRWTRDAEIDSLGDAPTVAEPQPKRFSRATFDDRDAVEHT